MIEEKKSEGDSTPGNNDQIFKKVSLSGESAGNFSNGVIGLQRDLKKKAMQDEKKNIQVAPYGRSNSYSNRHPKNFMNRQYGRQRTQIKEVNQVEGSLISGLSDCEMSLLQSQFKSNLEKKSFIQEEDPCVQTALDRLARLQ